MREKNKDLPGMENHSGIPELDELGMEYAEIRDERIALTEREVELKGRLLEMMKKHGKKSYIRKDIEIRIVPSEEKVKVKIKKEKSSDAEASAA